MGNTPSGWVAPPYLGEATPDSACWTDQADAANVHPLPIANPGVAADQWGAGASFNIEKRLYVHFAAPLAVVKGLFFFQTGELNFTYGAGGPFLNPVIPMDVDLTPITAAFNPATLTWNNQAALTYGASFGALHYELNRGSYVSFAPNYRLQFTGAGGPGGLAGIPRTAAFYGLRFSVLNIADPGALFTSIRGSISLVPNVIKVYGN